jgi:hypothetical protein
MELEVALPGLELGINPHDTAVLVAIAQEAAPISSILPL